MSKFFWYGESADFFEQVEILKLSKTHRRDRNNLIVMLMAIKTSIIRHINIVGYSGEDQEFKISLDELSIKSNIKKSRIIKFIPVLIDFGLKFTSQTPVVHQLVFCLPQKTLIFRHFLPFFYDTYNTMYVMNMFNSTNKIEEGKGEENLLDKSVKDYIDYLKVKGRIDFSRGYPIYKLNYSKTKDETFKSKLILTRHKDFYLDFNIPKMNSLTESKETILKVVDDLSYMFQDICPEKENAILIREFFLKRISSLLEDQKVKNQNKVDYYGFIFLVNILNKDLNRGSY